jgi:hypothetical protein
MAHYDPETLVLLRQVLDDAWAALPEPSKLETVKSELAQHILKQAGDGVRDPAWLRACALANVIQIPADEAKAVVKKRPRTVHTATFEDRMTSEIRRLEEQARTLVPGKDREMLLRKARQTRTALHINEWLSSPGLMSPK